MNKVIISFVLLFGLSGCMAYTPIKVVVDEVCESSDAKKQVLVEELDAATFPHKLRVQCHKPSSAITGDAE